MVLLVVVVGNLYTNAATSTKVQTARAQDDYVSPSNAPLPFGLLREAVAAEAATLT